MPVQGVAMPQPQVLQGPGMMQGPLTPMQPGPGMPQPAQPMAQQPPPGTNLAPVQPVGISQPPPAQPSPASGPPGAAAPGQAALPMEAQKQILQQVMSLTPEQIAQLPDPTRAQVLALQQQFRSQQLQM